MLIDNGKLRIRNAGEADCGLLADWWNDGSVMAHAGFPNGIGTTPDEVRKKISSDSDETGRRLIIEHDGTPIGEMNYRSLGNGAAEIGIKICEPAMQNRGYGTILLRSFISGLFGMGFRSIHLDTNLKNTRAQHVYEKLGFKRIHVNTDSWRDQRGVLQSSVEYKLNYGGLSPLQ